MGTAGDAQRVAGAVERSVDRAHCVNRCFRRSSGRIQAVSNAGPLNSAGSAISPSDARADVGNALGRRRGGRGAQNASDEVSDDSHEHSDDSNSFRETPIVLREARTALASPDVLRDESDPVRLASDDLPESSDVLRWDSDIL